MDLRSPGTLVLATIAAVLGGYLVYRRLSNRSRRSGAAVANSESLTRLPAYQRALRAHRIRLAVLAVSACLLGGAAIVGAARPLDTTIDRPQTRSRDIMLCLDISGSMASFDAELVTTFTTLVKNFEGERIGMVIFNSSAATVFPLTDDYDFINDELDSAGKALKGDPEYDSFFAGTFNGRGTSLIGDGLATCATSFDRIDTQRARSIVFATDNHLAGRPLIDLDEAGELAKTKGVRVYGLNPEEDGADREASELRTVVTGTGGQYFTMDDETAVKAIVDAVQAQEASIIDSACAGPLHRQPRNPDGPGRRGARRAHRRQPEVVVMTIVPSSPGPFSWCWRWPLSSRSGGTPRRARRRRGPADPLAPHRRRGAAGRSRPCARPCPATRSTPPPPTSTSTSSSTRRAASSPRTGATSSHGWPGCDATSTPSPPLCPAPATPW